MAGFVVLVVALFLGGIVIGVAVVVAWAVRREDRRYSLFDSAPGRLATGARRLNGVAVRDLDSDPLRPVRELARSR
jgi:hypothetical protein